MSGQALCIPNKTHNQRPLTIADRFKDLRYLKILEIDCTEVSVVSPWLCFKRISDALFPFITVEALFKRFFVMDM